MRNVVFLSPYGAESWQQVIDRLPADLVPHFPETRSCETLAEAAAATLAGLPAQFDVVGLCYGSYLALEMFRQQPARFGRLVLLGASARKDDLIEHIVRAKRIARLADEPADIPEARRVGSPDRLLGPGGADDPAVRNRVMGWIGSVPRASYLAQQRHLAGRRDLRESLRGQLLEAVLLTGRFDRITGPHLAAELQWLTTGNAVHVLDCGHLPVAECPAEVAAEIRKWLLHANASSAPSAKVVA